LAHSFFCIVGIKTYFTHESIILGMLNYHALPENMSHSRWLNTVV